MKVFILTEGGHYKGFGHITRCIAIYQAFETQNIHPVLIINSDKTTNHILRRKRHIDFDWIKDQKRLLLMIKNSDLVIVDSYIAGIHLYNRIASSVKKLVCIDDNNRLDYPQGIVVNGTRYAKDLDFHRKNGVVYLLGTQYALFQKEFWNIKKKEVRRNISCILLILGGTDTRNLTLKILKIIIAKYPKILKKVVITKGYKNLHAITKIKDNKLLIIQNPKPQKIQELLLSCDIAIATGGQILYETVITGIPTIAISASENQLRSIKDLTKSGLVDYAGKWNDKMLLSRLQKILKNLEPYEKRSLRSVKLKKVFDGKSTIHLVKDLIKYGQEDA